MSKIWNVVQRLFRRVFGRGRGESMADCTTSGNGKLKPIQIFQENHRVSEIHRRQIKGALGRLDETIQKFGEELVITAKANGNSHGKIS